MRITGNEPSNLKPFNLAARVNAAGNLTAWNNIQDALGNYYMEPYDEPYLHQIFWGVTPPMCRVYFQYPSREDRWSLLSMERVITGDIGYVDGKMSPFDGPLSPKTEVWTVHELWPAFNVYNPLSQPMRNILMNFDVMRYTYKILKDKSEIKEYLLGYKPRHMYTMAGIDPRPAVEPEWLRRLNKDDKGDDLWAWTKEGMSKGVWA